MGRPLTFKFGRRAIRPDNPWLRNGRIDYAAMLSANKGLIYYVLMRRRIHEMERRHIADYVAEAQLALCKAAESFDPQRPTWGTWARTAIANAVTSHSISLRRLKNIPYRLVSVGILDGAMKVA